MSGTANNATTPAASGHGPAGKCFATSYLEDLLAPSASEDDFSQQDQVKVFSHEGDGENTEHLNSMDLHDIKTELERDAEAEKAEVCAH